MPREDQFSDHASFLRALRDWFAGQALTGLLAAERAHQPTFDDPFGVPISRIAKRAYEFAGAMIIARADYEKSAARLAER